MKELKYRVELPQSKAWLTSQLRREVNHALSNLKMSSFF